MATNDGVPLAHLKAGESGVVLRLGGGSRFVGRMAALGFTPGTTLNVARNSGRGPIIVNLLDTQIALGRGQAYRVYVRQRRDHE
ncbi:MAG: FeoA family protein [Chloroflexota bacterium]|nr:FeoA family protein [Chloroflexota bacterium]